MKKKMAAAAVPNRLRGVTLKVFGSFTVPPRLFMKKECTLHEIYRRFRPLFFLFIAFFAGCILTGFFLGRQRPRIAGELDRRYALEHGRAAEIIGQLEEELGRERELNRKLREHNKRARELTEGLTDTVERNVRNLQDAVGLIGEIRKKLKVLEEFYTRGDSGNGGY
ncbi:MAG: hypothetical protein LBG91_05055 [Treponema sp.]|jgi:hypothetical protein|nr:hypothetical protein [Treponema sp.]